MRKSLHTSKMVVAALAVGAALAAAPAQAVLLSDLISGQVPEIVVGDKTFTNFTVTVTGIPVYQADPANIEVTGVIDPNNPHNIGLKFTPVSPTAAMIFAHPGALVDVLLGFDAIATDPLKIIGVDLAFVGNAPADGLAQIVETVYGEDSQLTQLKVSTMGSSQVSAALPNQYHWVRVVKDIAVVAGETGGASVNEFTQMFLQTPEPTTVLLLALGGAALFGRSLARRRRLLAIALVVGLGGLLMQPSTASAVLLSDLTDNPADSVSYGNFVFDNFQINIVSSNGKWIANQSAIDVQGFTIPDGTEDGLRFAGLIAALSNVTTLSEVTLTISYDVTLIDQMKLIHDVTMSFNGAPEAPDGVAQVGKSILVEGSSVGELMVYNEQPGPADPIKLLDHQVLNGNYTKIHVHDRIIVEGGISGATTISFINQTFSLVPIPEPTTLLAALLGLPLLGMRRRTR